MENKKDNNLIMVRFKDGNRYYFTSMNRAALFLNIGIGSVNWALMKNQPYNDNNGFEVDIKLVDGSEVKYKNINNTAL